MINHFFNNHNVCLILQGNNTAAVKIIDEVLQYFMVLLDFVIINTFIMKAISHLAILSISDNRICVCKLMLRVCLTGTVTTHLPVSEIKHVFGRLP